MGTSIILGGRCAHTQSPDPFGRTCLVVMEWKLISRRGISVWSDVTLETSGVKHFFFLQTIRLVLNSRTKRGGGGGVGWYHLSEIKREKGMHDVGNFGIQFYLIV